MSGVYYIEVSEDEDGQRLDRFLQKHLKGVPFGLLQKLMRKGQIRVDSKRVKPATRLEQGQSVRIPPMETREEKPKDFVSEKDAALIRSLVIYDEGDIIAINKPSGLATQGGTNITSHVDGMLGALANEKGVKPRLVHRLDKETSGVLLLARSADMAKKLGKIFQGRNIQKIYWALTAPAPEMNQGEIRAPLLKDTSNDFEKMIIDDAGQPATTYFDIIERAHKQMAFVAFWPKTGRTHQIRVHAAHMGAPIIGDRKYTRDDLEISVDGVSHAKRLHLHARKIAFRHPDTNKEVMIEASLPEELEKSWKSFGFDPQTQYDPFQDIQKKSS
ncbi:MAG: RluA family pseudouridine synthase [Pseudomonadota bacterium]